MNEIDLFSNLYYGKPEEQPIDQAVSNVVGPQNDVSEDEVICFRSKSNTEIKKDEEASSGSKS